MSENAALCAYIESLQERLAENAVQKKKLDEVLKSLENKVRDLRGALLDLQSIATQIDFPNVCGSLYSDSTMPGSDLRGSSG